MTREQIITFCSMLGSQAKATGKPRKIGMDEGFHEFVNATVDQGDLLLRLETANAWFAGYDEGWPEKTNG